MRYLNDFHRQQHALSKQMEKERSEEPQMSQQERLDQVRRLSRESRAAATARKPRSGNGLFGKV